MCLCVWLGEVSVSVHMFVWGMSLSVSLGVGGHGLCLCCREQFEWVSVVHSACVCEVYGVVLGVDYFGCARGQGTRVFGEVYLKICLLYVRIYWVWACMLALGSCVCISVCGRMLDVRWGGMCVRCRVRE